MEPVYLPESTPDGPVSGRRGNIRLDIAIGDPSALSFGKLTDTVERDIVLDFLGIQI